MENFQGVTYTSYPPMSVMATTSSFSFSDSTFTSFFEPGELKYSGGEERELVEVHSVDPTLLSNFNTNDEEHGDPGGPEEWEQPWFKNPIFNKWKTASSLCKMLKKIWTTSFQIKMSPDHSSVWHQCILIAQRSYCGYFYINFWFFLKSRLWDIWQQFGNDFCYSLVLIFQNQNWIDIIFQLERHLKLWKLRCQTLYIFHSEGICLGGHHSFLFLYILIFIHWVQSLFTHTLVHLSLVHI